MSARNQERRPHKAPQARTARLRFPNWTRFSCRMMQVAFFDNACLQPLVDHSPDHAVRDPLVEKAAQMAVWNRNTYEYRYPAPRRASAPRWHHVTYAGPDGPGLKP